jgi:hypothetical protein
VFVESITLIKKHSFHKSSFLYLCPELQNFVGMESMELLRLKSKTKVTNNNSQGPTLYTMLAVEEQLQVINIKHRVDH